MDPVASESLLRRSKRKRITTQPSPPNPSLSLASSKRRKVDSSSSIPAVALPAQGADVVGCIRHLRKLGLEEVVDVWVNEIFEQGNEAVLQGRGAFQAEGRSDSTETCLTAIWRDNQEVAKGLLAKCYRSLRVLECRRAMQCVKKVLESWPEEVRKVALQVWEELRRQDPKVFLNEGRLCNVRREVPANGRVAAWAAAGVRGWTEDGEGRRHALHCDLEDVLYVPPQHEPFLHTVGDTSFRIFVLTDGHGGRSAAEWFTKRVPPRVREILDSHSLWNLDDEVDRDRLKNELKRTFSALDMDFCELRKAEYEAHTSLGNLAHHDNGMAGRVPPDDDGCTLNVVLITDNWFISAHVGDSRTVLAKKSSTATKPVYSLEFATLDHSPSHPQRALAIHEAGGIFKETKNSPAVAINLETPGAALKNVNHSRSISYQTIRYLESARVFRPPEFVHPYGLPIKNMSLSDAMGDLTMKFPPAIFTALPDVEFVRLDADAGYMILIASDGVWTYLKEEKGRYAECVGLVAAFENRKIWEGWDGAGREDEWGSCGSETLEGFVKALCARKEGPFQEDFFQAEVWDDVSAVIVEMQPIGSRHEPLGSPVMQLEGECGTGLVPASVKASAPCFGKTAPLKSRFVLSADECFESMVVPETPPDVSDEDVAVDAADEHWDVVSVDLDPTSGEDEPEDIGQATGSSVEPGSVRREELVPVDRKHERPSQST